MMKETVQVIELPEGDQNTESPRKSLDFDDILKEIGEFGRFQILVGVLIGICSAFSAFIIFNFVFGGNIPEHR